MTKVGYVGLAFWLVCGVLAANPPDSFQFDLSVDAGGGGSLQLNAINQSPLRNEVDCNAAVLELKNLIKLSQLARKQTSGPEDIYEIARKAVSVAAVFPNPDVISMKLARNALEITWKKPFPLSFENQKLPFDGPTGEIIRDALKAVAKKDPSVPSSYFARYTHCWDPSPQPPKGTVVPPSCELSCASSGIPAETVQVAEIETP